MSTCGVSTVRYCTLFIVVVVCGASWSDWYDTSALAVGVCWDTMLVIVCKKGLLTPLQCYISELPVTFCRIEVRATGATGELHLSTRQG